MQFVDLLVELKVPDVTALTAAGALRRSMGYEDVLKGLRRSDLYRFELDVGGQEKALQLVDDIARNTNLFVNPNKNTFQVQLPAETASPSSDDWHAIRVLITASGGNCGGALAETLRQRLGYGDAVRNVTEGILWTLELAADSRKEALRLAEDITVTETRENGLLMNPHYQEYEILQEPQQMKA